MYFEDQAEDGANQPRSEDPVANLWSQSRINLERERLDQLQTSALGNGIVHVGARELGPEQMRTLSLFTAPLDLALSSLFPEETTIVSKHFNNDLVTQTRQCGLDASDTC